MMSEQDIHNSLTNTNVYTEVFPYDWLQVPSVMSFYPSYHIGKQFPRVTALPVVFTLWFDDVLSLTASKHSNVQTETAITKDRRE